MAKRKRARHDEGGKRARHDEGGDHPKLFEHLTGLLQASSLRVAGGEIARECRVLRHVLPGCEKCVDRIVEPTLKKMSATDQHKVRRILKSRAQANGGLDMLDRNIRLARVKF